MLTLGFAGLPSAGKSTIVNALAGKRVLESGICRTTTEVCVVGTTNAAASQKWVRTKLESDDGVEFCAVDLPGICDVEDKKGTFNKVTREWAAKCDVVVWVTDARTAFLTTHEAQEYAALRMAIQEKADEDGTLYQFLIVIAKFDATSAASAASSTKNNNNCGVRFLDDEIRTGTEDTTIDSCFERVERMFPDTRVAKFSAFARIVKSGSEALRALVSASSIHTDGTNDTFDLKWATENLVEKRFAQMTRVLRNTRHRAIDAETRLRMVDERLAVLTSRVTSSAPVYDEIVEFEIGKLQSYNQVTHHAVLGSQIHAFTMRMDKAVTTCDVFSEHTMLPGSVSIGQIRIGGKMTNKPIIYMSMGSCCEVDAQFIAPTVRPAYGDVAYSISRHGSRTLVIYAGEDVGEKYAHKVGEVNRDQVAALIAALRGKSDYHWRSK
jgi:hypothetical protein